MAVRTVCPILVSEGTSFRYTGVLKNQAGVVIPSTDLITLTLSIHLDDQSQSPEVVNGCFERNILNVNGGTVDLFGALTLLLTPDDNEIVHPDALDESRIEVHVLSLEWTYLTPGGIGRGRHEVQLNIKNLYLSS